MKRPQHKATYTTHVMGMDAQDVRRWRWTVECACGWKHTTLERAGEVEAYFARHERAVRQKPQRTP